MIVTITLPESPTTRTHIAAKVACDYVSYTLSKLGAEAWLDLMENGCIFGEVEADFVGVVTYSVSADSPSILPLVEFFGLTKPAADVDPNAELKTSPVLSTDCSYGDHSACEGEESALWPDGALTMRLCSCECHGRK